MPLSFIKINVTVTAYRVNCNLHVFEQLSYQTVSRVSLDIEGAVMSAGSQCIHACTFVKAINYLV